MTESKRIMKERLIAMRKDLTEMCDVFKIESPLAARTMGVNVDLPEKTVSRLKSAVIHGHVSGMSATVVKVLNAKLDEIEREHGELPYVDPRYSLKGSGAHKSVEGKTATFIKNTVKQIEKLEAEFID